MNTTTDREALKATIILIHSRYNWGEKKFGFEKGQDEASLGADRRQMITLRKEFDWTLEKDKKITPSMENLALCIQAARLIFGRYQWSLYKFNFTEELTGTPDEIVIKLKEDFERLYAYRQDKAFFKKVTANNRVLSTLEGLMFQAITSIKPFSVKRHSDFGHFVRVMRCLEGLIYQLLVTINPNLVVSQ